MRSQSQVAQLSRMAVLLDEFQAGAVLPLS